MTHSDAGELCPFCQIVAGRLPSSQVYADDEVLAFLDIRPITAGHLLVIPRTHATGLAGLAPAAGARMFVVAQQLAAALYRSGLPCEGVNFFLADGAAAGQKVFHPHLHVLPRSAGDGFQLTAQFQHPDRDELDGVAARIRAAALT